MRKTRGFTLAEILVVIAILIALAALLIPAVSKARARAAQTRCAVRLQQVGQMLQMYFGENRNTLPKLNMMPSLQPPLNLHPSLAQLLSPYARGVTQVFECPSDQITQPASGAPAGFETYFEREQCSYFWNDGVSLLASRITELKGSDGVLLVQEYEPFHGRTGASGAMNRLYADPHVDAAAHEVALIGG